MSLSDGEKRRMTLFDQVLPKLRPFQREAVEFATKGKRYNRQWASSSSNGNKNTDTSIDASLLGKGRILLADEMGLGKTVTSLAIMAYYEPEWPLLILCPASLRYTWPAEIEKFFPSLPPQSIYIAKGFQDVGFTKRQDVKVLILTYSLFQERSAVSQAVKNIDWHCIIADESHNLKSRTSQRSKLVLPLLQRSRRLVLLSGTPAVAKPAELWTQISCIAPKLFGNWTTYANRYCSPRRKSFGAGRFVMDYSGSSNESELHAKLLQVMVRRLKNDVLQELPPKQRSIVPVSIFGREDLANCKRIMAELAEKRTSIEDLVGEDAQKADFQAKSTLMRAFQATGIGKANAVSEYLLDWVAGSETQKILVFAHHKEVLDRLDKELLSKCPNTHIRIDGSVPTAIRAQLVRKFQTCARVRVALLSVTAAGVGLTLTAASTVLFAELHWTPGVLAQAEDRSHRIGNTHDSVQIVYMVCKDPTVSVDMSLWKMLGRKINTLDQVVDGKKETPYIFQANESANNDELRSAVSGSSTTKSAQAELTEFFAESAGNLSRRNGQPRIPAKGTLESFFRKASSTTTQSVPGSSSKKGSSFADDQEGTALAGKRRSRNDFETAGAPNYGNDDSSVGDAVHEEQLEVACDVCTSLSKVPLTGEKWFACEMCGNLIKHPSAAFSESKKHFSSEHQSGAPGKLVKEPAVAFSESKKRCSSDPHNSSSSKVRKSSSFASTKDLVSWSCMTCTLENSMARSSTGFYACVACQQPYTASAEESLSSSDSDSELDALLKTPAPKNRKASPAIRVTVSTGKKSGPPSRSASAFLPSEVIVLDDDCPVEDHRHKSASSYSDLIEIDATDSPAPFTKTACSSSSPEVILLDDDISDGANDNVASMDTKPKATGIKSKAAVTPKHVLEFSVSEHSGRLTIHNSGKSSMVNFDVEDVLTDESSDLLMDARIKKVSFERQDVRIDFDCKRLQAVLQRVESTFQGQSMPRAQMEEDLKSFVTHYLRLRSVEKMALQKSGKALPPHGLSQSVAKLLVASSNGTERYVGGAKERAQQNAANGTASEQDLAVLDRRSCAWCGKGMCAASMRAESTYCSQECAEEGRLRRGGRFASANIRSAVFALEGGKCTLCGVDAHALFEQIRSLQPAERLNKLLAFNWKLPASGKGMESLLQEPKEGNFWQVDHIRAVKEGGGDSGLENLRTLCVPCHTQETTRLRTRLQLHGPHGETGDDNGGNKSVQVDIRTLFASAGTRISR